MCSTNWPYSCVTICALSVCDGRYDLRIGSLITALPAAVTLQTQCFMAHTIWQTAAAPGYEIELVVVAGRRN